MYRPLRVLPLILTVFMPNIVFSQPDDSLPALSETYYASLKNKLSVHVYGITKFNNIELRSPSGDTIVRFKPNENFNLGAGFNYKWAGISAAFNFKFINNDDHIYGKTTSFDLQSDIYSRKYIWTINLQSYTGFYRDNTFQYDSVLNAGESVLLRPDISTFNLGANMIYTFNHGKFSFKAPYTYTERQKRSAGSWLYGTQLSLYALVADSILIPFRLQRSFPLYDSLITMVTFSLGNSIGYSYTFVFYRQFYISATLMLGLSMQAVGAYDVFGRPLIEEGRFSTKSLFRLSIGANNDRCYYGISLAVDNYPIRNKFQSSFVYNYGKIRIFYGRHFSLESRRKKNIEGSK